MISIFTYIGYLLWLLLLIACTLLSGWLFSWSLAGIALGIGLGFFIGLFAWLIFKYYRYRLIEDVIFLTRTEQYWLEKLNSSYLDENSRLYSFLNKTGFFFVRHRRALTVFSRGVYLYSLESELGHRWHHIWPYRKREEIGPEIELSKSFVAREYDNVPTSMGLSLAERLSGQGEILAPSGPGRPVPITIKLVIGYVFRPQSGSVRDAFQKAIHRSTEERNNTVCTLARPDLERITGQISPIDIKLRVADGLIRPRLVESLQRLRALGYEVTSVEIDSVTLPSTFDTAFVANEELLKQSVSDYSSDDLARMLATQLGQGLRTGVETVPGLNLGSAIQRSMRLENPHLQEDVVSGNDKPEHDSSGGETDQPQPNPPESGNKRPRHRRHTKKY